MPPLKTSTHTDLPAIARCHRAAFPGALASALGQRYVAEMLSWYLSTDKTFLFHLEVDGICAGYCGGMISDGTLATGSASGMAQHSFGAAVHAFLLRPWVLFHKEVRAKYPLLWRNLLMKLGLRAKVHAPAQKAKQRKDPHAGLVVIGVDPAFQGKGYGSVLLKEFERRVVEDYGVHKLQLTVLANNVQAIRAYERNGWMRGIVQGRSLGMEKFVGNERGRGREGE